MDYVNKLLDKCKEVRNLRTDSELSDLLKVKKQTLSGWRHGDRLPDPVACANIAAVTGEPLAKVIGTICEARAISSDEKRVWRRLASIAASLLTSCNLLGLYIMLAFEIFIGRFISCNTMAHGKM